MGMTREMAACAVGLRAERRSADTNAVQDRQPDAVTGERRGRAQEARVIRLPEWADPGRSKVPKWLTTERKAHPWDAPDAEIGPDENASPEFLRVRNKGCYISALRPNRSR